MHTHAISLILCAVYPVQVQERNTVPDTIPKNKTLSYAGLRRRAMTGVDDLSKIIWGLHQDHVHLQTSHPMGESHGTESTAATLSTPPVTALLNLEGPDLIVMGSSFKGRKYVAMMRLYYGTFRRDRPTIPATGCPLYVPYNGVSRGKIGDQTAYGMC